MQSLIARTEILYNGRMYPVGAELPVNNKQMVDAWIEAKTAVWKGSVEAPEPEQEEDSEQKQEEDSEQKQEEDSEQKQEENTEPVKGVPQTAEPGLPGTAVGSDSEDGEDLVGKVPQTAARKRK